MANTALFSFKRDKDGKIRVCHIFFGEDEDQAEKNLQEHAEICPKFGPAYQADETVEIPVEVTELPEGDQDDLEAWIDEELLGEEDEED